MRARRALAVLVAAVLSFIPLAAPSASASGNPRELVNPGFENPQLDGWKATGRSAGIVTPGRTGNQALAIDGTATVEQTIRVPNGTYTVSAWAQSSGGQKSAHLFAEGGRTALPVSTTWTQIVIRGLTVSRGKLTVGLRVDGRPEATVRLDDVEVVSAAEPYTFYKGGDITMLNWVEDSGGRYYDTRGHRRDPLDILRDSGVNIVRLRLYNGTGPGHPRIGYPNDYLPEGYQDEKDMLDLARRAAQRDMAIQLTLHYSDYWSNGAIQDIPKDWRDVTSLPEAQAIAKLEKYVYDYTKRIMRKMKAQGTTPAFVSLGNETAGGFLFPYGAAYGQSDAFAKLARFYKAGYQAVKDVSPRSQVIIHLDAAGDDGKYEWYFGELEKLNVPFDLIGSSYYPYWTQKDVPTVLAFFERMYDRFGKKIMVMESGVNWSPVTHDGIKGQLLDNGPVPYGETPEGQRDFLYELFAGLKTVKDGAVIGDLYWDPVMIPADGVGWQVGGDNVVSNTTLFDFEGKALPALQAYADN